MQPYGPRTEDLGSRPPIDDFSTALAARPGKASGRGVGVGVGVGDLLEAAEDGPRSPRYQNAAHSSHRWPASRRKRAISTESTGEFISLRERAKEAVSGVHATLIKPQVRRNRHQGVVQPGTWLRIPTAAYMIVDVPKVSCGLAEKDLSKKPDFKVRKQ